MQEKGRLLQACRAFASCGFLSCVVPELGKLPIRSNLLPARRLMGSLSAQCAIILFDFAFSEKTAIRWALNHHSEPSRIIL